MEGSRAWLSVPYKKFKGYLPDKQLQKFLETQADGRYFLVSLQVHNDSQIIDHSPYADVKEFITEVIKSFALTPILIICWYLNITL